MQTNPHQEDSERDHWDRDPGPPPPAPPRGPSLHNPGTAPNAARSNKGKSGTNAFSDLYRKVSTRSMKSTKSNKSTGEGSHIVTEHYAGGVGGNGGVVGGSPGANSRTTSLKTAKSVPLLSTENVSQPRNPPTRQASLKIPSNYKSQHANGGNSQPQPIPSMPPMPPMPPPDDRDHYQQQYHHQQHQHEYQQHQQHQPQLYQHQYANHPPSSAYNPNARQPSSERHPSEHSGVTAPYGQRFPPRLQSTHGKEILGLFFRENKWKS